MAIFETTTSFPPIFDGENYNYWSIKMKTFFLSQDLWDVVQKGVATPSEGVSNSAQHKQESTKDARALYILQQAVSNSIFPRLMMADTSKDAWEILRSEFQRNAKVKIIELQGLRREFENLKMKEFEEVKEYYSRLIEIVNQMRAYGEEVADQRIVQKILLSLPKKYDPIVAAIEVSKDLQILSVTELMGSLQAYEQTMARRSDSSLEHDFQLQCDDVVIDMSELDFPSPAECCIYRVPKRLRQVNPMAYMSYTPRLVSIGPFHYSLRKELKEMERQKHRYLRDFQLKRSKKSKEELASIIRPDVLKIRRCYSEPFLLLSNEVFVNMIVLDAIFILELFLRKYENPDQAHDAQKDYILSRPCMERGIQQDLLLLENQLPFFVLEKLYQNGEPNTKTPTFLELSCKFFGDLYDKWLNPVQCCDVKQCFRYLVGSSRQSQDLNKSSEEPKIKPCDIHGVKHFTDLVRCFFRPLEEPKSEKINKISKRTKPLYTATKLGEAGLKFTTPNSERDLLNIRFREKNRECLKRCPCFNLSWLLSCLPCLKSTCFSHMQCFLEVPPLRVDDKTEGLFRNLMALEQCHYPLETYICDYIVLLDDLITTKEDVRLLVEKKIILNELGSNVAVTKLFNNLGLEIEESRNHYGDLCEQLNDYYGSDWNRLVGTLTSIYFTDFFKGTATVVGLIVLGLTFWNFNRLLKLYINASDRY